MVCDAVRLSDTVILISVTTIVKIVNVVVIVADVDAAA